ncbi:MAG TPA: ABC transporter permease [Candidatus Acidoferrum sp.]|nr:ABC transporter permease [Candidatus Acidoferrum sp.]
MHIGKAILLMAGSLRLIWRFRLRSGLILLSALLGVGGVISSISYTAEGRMKVLNRIQRLGTNVLVVTPQLSRNVGGRAKTGTIVTTLVSADYAEILREIPEIEQSSATITTSFLVKAGDLSKSNCIVMGTEPDYARIRHWQTTEGEFYEIPEMRRSARVAVLGSTVRRDLFGSESPIGKRLFINRVPFEVIGVLEERGQGLDATNEDNQVYVPLSTAMRRLANVDYFSAILFAVTRWDRMDETTEAIHQVLSKRHRAPGNLTEDFQIQNQKALIDTEIASSNRLTFLVRWVGLSGLAVSGLGILAICWIAVGERVGEIGIRRALGATKSDIFFQFLFEAVIISILGCFAGLMAGWRGTESIARSVDLPFYFDWTSAELVVGFAMFMNLVFALIPSRRAALLDPILALKSE